MSKKPKASPQDASRPVRITIYRWAGQWGPFKVKIPCGECALTVDVVKDTLKKELAGVPVELEIKDWLSVWWEPLKLFPLRGYHAPVVLVEGEIVSEGVALNRGVLAEKVAAHAAERFPLAGVQVFGKPGCPHCIRAKTFLDSIGTAYDYHDVVENPGAMYQMLARVKREIPKNKPITVPQVWIDGAYVGGADDLLERLGATAPAKTARLAEPAAPAATATPALA